MIIKPMLGFNKVVPLEEVRMPCIASPKIDGIRLFNWLGNCFTRTMKPIGCRFVQSYISNSILKGLDGECVVGEPNDPKIFKKTTGAVRTHSAEPDFDWWVFDERIGEKDLRGFWERYNTLKERFERGDFAQFTRVKLLEHVWINTHEELKQFEDKCAAEGWEGVMTRDPDGPYKMVAQPHLSSGC
ncbi:ATP-dependent DNA ligase [Aeromonas phage Gekk3-15]